MAFLALPRDHKIGYEKIGYREKLDAVDEGIRRWVFSYISSIYFSLSLIEGVADM